MEVTFMQSFKISLHWTQSESSPHFSLKCTLKNSPHPVNHLCWIWKTCICTKANTWGNQWKAVCARYCPIYQIQKIKFWRFPRMTRLDSKFKPHLLLFFQQGEHSLALCGFIFLFLKPLTKIYDQDLQKWYKSAQLHSSCNQSCIIWNTLLHQVGEKSNVTL